MDEGGRVLGGHRPHRRVGHARGGEGMRGGTCPRWSPTPPSGRTPIGCCWSLLSSVIMEITVSVGCQSKDICNNGTPINPATNFLQNAVTQPASDTINCGVLVVT